MKCNFLNLTMFLFVRALPIRTFATTLTVISVPNRITKLVIPVRFATVMKTIYDTTATILATDNRLNSTLQNVLKFLFIILITSLVIIL